MVVFTLSLFNQLVCVCDIVLALLEVVLETRCMK
jgi:hypothetical protein